MAAKLQTTHGSHEPDHAEDIARNGSTPIGWIQALWCRLARAAASVRCAPGPAGRAVRGPCSFCASEQLHPDLADGVLSAGGAWLPGRPKWLGHPAAPRVALRRGPLDGKARRLLPFQGRGRPDRHGLGNAALHFPSADRCIRRPFSIFPPALASGLFKLFGRLLVSSSDPPAASITI